MDEKGKMEDDTFFMTMTSYIVFLKKKKYFWNVAESYECGVCFS